MIVNQSCLVRTTHPMITSLMSDQWQRPALASCHVLKFVGGYLAFVFVAGIALNGFVLHSLLDRKRARSPIRVFMIALAIADLMAAVLGIPLPLTSNLACRWLYGKYLCYYEGFVAYFVGMVGLYLLTALSLNRYWMIVTPDKAKYVTFQTAYLSVLFSILGSLFWAIGPILGWNGYTLEGVLTSCSIRWQDRTLQVVSYNVSMFVFAYLVPLFIIIYCNGKIYLEVRRASLHGTICRVNRGVLIKVHRVSFESRMAKTIWLIVASFTVSWTPYAIVAFISSFLSPTFISPLAGTLPAVFAKSSICFVPLVYIVTNSQIRPRISLRRRRMNRSSEVSSVKK